MKSKTSALFGENHNIRLLLEHGLQHHFSSPPLLENKPSVLLCNHAYATYRIPRKVHHGALCSGHLGTFPLLHSSRCALVDILRRARSRDARGNLCTSCLSFPFILYVSSALFSFPSSNHSQMSTKLKDRSPLKNFAQWKSKINIPVFSRLVDMHQDMEITALDVVGQKAILEARGKATQKNGRPYNNRLVKSPLILSFFNLVLVSVILSVILMLMGEQILLDFDL